MRNRPVHFIESCKAARAPIAAFISTHFVYEGFNIFALIPDSTCDLACAMLQAFTVTIYPKCLKSERHSPPVSKTHTSHSAYQPLSLQTHRSQSQTPLQYASSQVHLEHSHQSTCEHLDHQSGKKRRRRL